MLKSITAVLLVSLPLASAMPAESFTYDAIARRHSSTQLDAPDVLAAQMQGECLVGLKQLNFRKKDNFDPVAEWTNYRAISLLEQFPPCTVLIMMEVARKELLELAGGSGA